MGILGSAIASNYGSSLVFRLSTGISSGMVLPNYFAIIADVFLTEGRDKAIGWTFSATGFGAAIGVAMVHFLLEVGDRRLTLVVTGIISLVLWLLL